MIFDCDVVPDVETKLAFDTEVAAIRIEWHAKNTTPQQSIFSYLVPNLSLSYYYFVFIFFPHT
jgi:hypothetical protein